MTILKSEHALLTREEFTTIKKCIKLMMTIKKGAADPVLTHEAHTIALSLEQFRSKFTICENASVALQEMLNEAVNGDE